jgi:hypothetical protein
VGAAPGVPRGRALPVAEMALRLGVVEINYDNRHQEGRRSAGHLAGPLRVAARLSHLTLVSTIAAAGEHGPYFLALCPGVLS